MLEQYPDEAADVVAASCRYGQQPGLFGLDEPQDHYEETNSVGWDLAADLFAAVEAVTGRTASGSTVNPDFEGYWRGSPPPAP